MWRSEAETRVEATWHELARSEAERRNDVRCSGAECRSDMAWNAAEDWAGSSCFGAKPRSVEKCGGVPRFVVKPRREVKRCAAMRPGAETRYEVSCSGAEPSAELTWNGMEPRIVLPWSEASCFGAKPRSVVPWRELVCFDIKNEVPS